MKRHLNIAIESGATTCQLDNGKACDRVGVKSNSALYVCKLFVDKHGNEQELHGNGCGFLARLPECMRAEVGA